MNELSRILVDSVAEITTDRHVTYFHYDENTHRLTAEATTAAVDHSEIQPLPPTDNPVGKAWTTNTTVKTREQLVSQGIPDETGQYVAIPVGSYGVLLRVIESEVREANMDDYITVLVQGMEESLERTTLDRQVSAHESQMEAAKGQLSQLVDVNEEVRRIGNRVLRIQNENELGNFVCQRLTGIDPFTASWFVQYRQSGEKIVSESRCGNINGYIDSVGQVGTADGEKNDIPTIRAIQSEKPVIFNNIADDLRSAKWRQVAVSQGFASVISVPLQFEDQIFGAISLYGDRKIEFPDQTIAAIVDLGETVAHVLHRIKQERSLLSPNSLGITFTIEDVETPVNALSNALDASVLVFPYAEETVGQHSFLCEVNNVPAETVRSACQKLGPVIDWTLIGEGKTTRFTISSTRTLLPERIAELGGQFQKMAVSDSKSDVTAQFPKSMSLRTIQKVLSESYPSVEVARKWVSTKETVGPTGRTGAELTDRQREIVDLAVEEGYFEWPRDVSGEELAAKLDIDPSTLSRHLRVGLRKIVYSTTDSRE